MKSDIRLWGGGPWEREQQEGNVFFVWYVTERVTNENPVFNIRGKIRYNKEGPIM